MDESASERMRRLEIIEVELVRELERSGAESRGALNGSRETARLVFEKDLRNFDNFILNEQIPEELRADEHRGAILLVDDDASIRKVVKAILQAAGYSVISATDGTDGLAFFKQNRSAIALLLTDVAMPNMNGLDMADRILELDGKLPILFMSGTALYADRGYGCLEKPFRASELLGKVGAMLRRPSAQSLDHGNRSEQAILT